MERLIGKSILIGKEPGQGRLLVAVAVEGQPRQAILQTAVPDSVSRCKPHENIAHCKITVDDNGSLRLFNLKSQNVTYVDGMEIESKAINANSRVALGKDHFPISIAAILNAAKQLVPQSNSAGSEGNNKLEGGFSIAHLEKVWDEYETALEHIQIKQQKANKMRMLPIMIGSLSAVASPVIATVAAVESLYITVPIAAISFLMYFVIYQRKDTSIDEKKEANMRFMTHYVCPNPECRHFMGNQHYQILAQSTKCPYCGAKFSTE